MGHANWLFSVLLLSGVASTAAAGPADTCADCHAKDGASTEPDVPIIGGQSAAYLSDSLADYRDKKRPCPQSKYRGGDKSRPATDMCKIAQALSEKAANDVTQALAAKPFLRPQQTFDAAKAAAGKKVHELHCEKCHADGGSSKADDSGILAGQWNKYLQAAFKEIAEGTRPVPKKMKPKFEELSEAEREALLQYYASFK